MPALSITQALGGAERGFRALLDRELERTALTFPEWIALIFVDAASSADAGGLTAEVLAERFAAGSVAPPSTASTSTASPSTAADVLGRLAAKALVIQADGAFAFTAGGQRDFRELRQRVDRLVAELQRGIPAADLVTARHVLGELGRRAAEELARPDGRPSTATAPVPQM